jgi:hypothetical protein
MQLWSSGGADPRRSTRTPVVVKIARAHHCAHRWANTPRLETTLENNDSVPSTTVYSVTAGIRKNTVRHQ